MVVTVPAVYEKGTLRLLKPIDLPEQAEVQVTIEAVTKSKPHYPTCSLSGAT
ncbi:MAG: antitoxin family protein [Anaerolineae bacterium]|nr:antitoxin family protein [Anaerolineae bacterium]